MNRQEAKAIIIGSGVAGLASAIRLACKGFRVQVFERNSYPGGKLSYFEQNGFKFDAGPSLFTQPWLIDELFALAGKRPEDYFTYSKAEETCRYFFANGKQLIANADPQKFAHDSERILGEPAKNITNYLANAKRIYDDTAELFLNHSLHKLESFKGRKLLKALRGARPAYLLQSMNKHHQKQFETAEIRQLFNRYATYNGSNPYTAPAMLSVIPHLEMNEGTYYPKGGMISITNALYQLACDLGVSFQFDCAVEKIIVANNRANGVVANGNRFEADVVVSNSDVYFVQRNLLGNPKAADKILKQERSSSAFIFYWGIKKCYKALGLHNIFFTADYQQEFNAIFKEKALFDDPTVYINITSKMEAEMAPSGGENWFVMINVPADSGQQWDEWGEQLRATVVKKISKVLGDDISMQIATEAILHPSLIETKTASYTGSLYGTSSNSRLAAFLRHANFSGTIANLYFTGGSVHPGGGIPLCLRSAAIVSNMIADLN